MVAETNIATETPLITYDGQHDLALDSKRRLYVPKKWRPATGPMTWKALLWPRQNMQGHYLVAVTTQAHANIMRELSRNSMADEKALAVLRFVSRNSGSLEMDGEGRIPLPANLAQGAGIEKAIVLVGMWDRFEIWAADRFNQVVALEDPSVPAELGRCFANINNTQSSL